ncbi:accessory Sec system glycosylation chaperone GtfB [Granulicatella sp. zg-ZJ]|uniref:accessory Sec system glycosylation chaperone GtfB n=1 Tax=Granulicatella sp. zg-ZJ TaxID=2678504 RepID=UPI0013D8A2CB|nr:accessory Sec system glycosylation chaperone GtfB [Granulicatella sp. zg-ZJ]NEW63219.1 accessory Sec system glycosylation chaperone GtfB [Granulicatella sp. zg-ZJ]
MINLFDHYNQLTKDLHQSLTLAGYTHPTVVIDDNGFLPEGIHSPYMYFLGQENKQAKALYFNQVKTPKFWEIKGTNTSGEIYCYDEKRANIFYAEPTHKRLVRTVEWLDKANIVRCVDYYNQYGRQYARTTYNTKQEPIVTTYYHVNGTEVIVENHKTGNILLSYREKIYTFKSKIEFIRFYLNEADFDCECVIYNTLALSFLVLYGLQTLKKGVLFWQEPIHDSIPGNMQTMFNDNREFKVAVPDRSVYENMQPLLTDAQKTKVSLSGYIYTYKRDNHYQPNALILTNSDQVEHLEDFIQELPHITFHVAALTEMSNRLTNLSKYTNVRLYQNVTMRIVDKLFQNCDVYLDINHANEILYATRRAFDYQLLLFSFTNTKHSHFVSPDNNYPSEQWKNMSQKLSDVFSNRQLFDTLLEKQKYAAHQVGVQSYRQLLR